MTTLHKAAQQALEALEWISDCYVGDDDDAGECASCHERSYRPHAPDCKKNNAITTLRAALAQQAEPVQEPVAWYRPSTAPHYYAAVLVQGAQPPAPLTQAEAALLGWKPLYTAPPQRRAIVRAAAEIGRKMK